MSDRGHMLSVSQFVAAEADRVISELVPMAGLLDVALQTNNVPLARARTADIHELFNSLCRGKLEALVVVMGVELARVGWAPDDHPDADIDPDEELPDSPPEIQWTDAQWKDAR